MKAITRLSLLICFFLGAGTFLLAQSGESKFKKVTLGSGGNKVNQYYASLRISHLVYSDENSDQQLEGNETGTISWYIKNTGTVQLRELIINVKNLNNNPAIDFIRNQNLNNIRVGDSVLVRITLKANEAIKSGMETFEINVGDAQSDCRKKAQIEIKTKGKV
jgi:uncharacterized membrane protein